MKKILLVLIMMVIAITFSGLLTACNPSDGNGENNINIIDMVGTEVTLTKNPTKVACVSRSTADLLIAFGLGDVIDGVYYAVLDNEWTEVIYPQSGSYRKYEYEESYETFYTRGVDLIFSPEKHIAEGLRTHGLPAITVSLYGTPNFDSYLLYFADLCKKLWGERAGVTEKITEWEVEFTEAKNAVTEELDKHSPETKTVHYVRGDKDKGIVYTDTTGCFLEAIYKILKVNFAGSQFATNKPSQEELLSVNPDIVVIGGIYQNKLLNDINTLPIWSNLNAVKNNRVYTVPIGFTMFEQLSALSPVFLYHQANQLYPEYFDYDIPALIKASHLKYFGITLSDTQITNMMSGLSSDGSSLVK